MNPALVIVLLTAIFAGLGSSAEINTIRSSEDFETSLAKWGKSGTHLILQADGFEMRIDATHAKHDVPYSKTHEREHETIYDVSRIHIQSINSDGTRETRRNFRSFAYTEFYRDFEYKFKKLESTQPSYKVKTLLEIQKNPGLGDESYNVAAALTVKYDRTKVAAEFVLPVYQGNNKIFRLEFHIFFNDPVHQTVVPRPIIWVYNTNGDMFPWDTDLSQLQFQWAVEEAKESPRINNEAEAAAEEQEARETAARAVAPPRIQRKEEWDSFFQSVTAPTNPNSTRTADFTFKAYVGTGTQHGFQLNMDKTQLQGETRTATHSDDTTFVFDVPSFEFSIIGKSNETSYLALNKLVQCSMGYPDQICPNPPFPLTSDGTPETVAELQIQNLYLTNKVFFTFKSKKKVTMANRVTQAIWSMEIIMTFPKANEGISIVMLPVFIMHEVAPNGGVDPNGTSTTLTVAPAPDKEQVSSNLKKSSSAPVLQRG